MDIVDAQVHLWKPESADRPWPEGRARDQQRPYPVLKESMLLQMDLAGVRRAVIVPPSWEGERNDVALDAAASHPDRFAVMGRLALTDPQGREKIRSWKRQPGMLGLRFTFHQPQYVKHLEDGSADWVWEEAERAGVPIMILVPGALDHLDRLASRFPDLKFVIDHVGLDRRGMGERVWEDLPRVCALARHSNVAVKASGMPSLSKQPYPFSDLHPHIRALVDAFGPQRTFWGTDLTRMSCTYYECIRLFTEHLPWLRGDDLAEVMGRGLCRWLDWPL
ncbi:MAG: amidohydrolase [Gammaproteobacteria bacterium]|nr:amidohydrolase [Gammaproteobacteria bacterium]